MHEAAAAVAGGSIRAMEAILRGDVEHAFHPGGGLHHAMPIRASGFCIYDDPALAIARARRDGLRVLYVDLDVHHGDGVQAIHWPRPGRADGVVPRERPVPVPGDRRFADEIGRGRRGRDVGQRAAASRAPASGAWLAAVATLLPELAAAFGPDIIVSQHGADSPRLGSARAPAGARRPRWARRPGWSTSSPTSTPAAAGWRPAAAATTPIGSCRGRGPWSGWPGRTATSRRRRRAAWRERWAAEAARYGQAPLPTTFDDPPTRDVGRRSVAAIRRTVDEVRAAVLPRLVARGR